MEKKANKIAFKSEKQKQEFSLMHSKQQQGKKLWRLLLMSYVKIVIYLLTV